MALSGFVHGREIDKDLELSCDVCIVGSGAGGSVLASRLAEKGRSVIVLEEGGYYTKKDFDLDEMTAFERLYQDSGLRSTTDTSITVLQGRSVGGSTTVNWTSCFRTPKRILDLWKSRFGVDTLSQDVLQPHFEAVERRLNIEIWPAERQNPNNKVLWRGFEKLGHSRASMRRNVRLCMNSGYCGFGCPVDAKQAMHITYLPDAVKNGATIIADCRAETVEVSNSKVVAIHAVVLDRAAQRPNGRKVVVKPKLAVISGGAINTPMLLLRSELNLNDRVGLRTFLHPATGLPGIYEDRIEPYYGAPQSVYSHQFEDRGPGKIGFFTEVAPLHPMLSAAAFGGIGADHQARMTSLPHTSMLAFLLIDGLPPEEQGGTVGLRSDGRPDIEYPLGALQMETFREATRELARAHLAAGAKRVHTLHNVPVVIEKESDLAKLDDAAWSPLQFPIFTFHQMGGATMGKDPSTSVVDPHLKHHHADNLFIVDGSVLPTALGVNPSETIYGIAHWAADHIAGAV